MIYDIHTHHHPPMPGEGIVQLTPDAPYRHPSHIYSVGLHPWHIDARWATSMGKLLIMALHPQVLMIGETGIDKVHGNAPMELQLVVFREHIRVSELVGKPLIVHCVKAFDELWAIRKESKATQPWIIHGFRGGVEQWRQLTRAGLHVSIGRYHDNTLIRTIPPTALLLESDTAATIDSVYAHVGHSRNTDVDTLKHQVDANIHSLLNAHHAE